VPSEVFRVLFRNCRLEAAVIISDQLDVTGGSDDVDFIVLLRTKAVSWSRRHDALNEYPACTYILPDITPYASCVCLSGDNFIIATSAVSIMLPEVCSLTNVAVEPVLTVAEDYCLDCRSLQRIISVPVTTPVTNEYSPELLW
jgi:hypothetical protein